MNKKLLALAVSLLILGNFFSFAREIDAGVVTIASLPAGSCQGTYPLQVQIKNFGQANLTRTIIAWTLNGVSQTPFIWTGNLAFNSVSPLFTIGYCTLEGFTDEVKAHTTLGHFQQDENPANDTAAATFLFTKLGGRFTLGGMHADFADFNSFILSLYAKGICGPVTLNVRDGAYAGITQTLNFIPGSSAANTLTIQSESGDSTRVIIGSPSSSDPPFNLWNADYITLKQLTIHRGFVGDAIVLNNGCERCSILNCIVNGKIQVLNSCHHNLLANNKVNDQIILSALSTAVSSGNTLRNNTLINDMGISCYYQDSLLVEKNIVVNPNSYPTSGNYAVKLLNNNGSSFKCIKNRIRGNFQIGLYLTQNGIGNNPGIVANNIVTAGPAGGIAAYLMCSQVLFGFNTLLVPAGVAGIPLQNASAPFDYGLDIRNNQCINYGHSLACYWGRIDATTHTFSDNNNYFTNGGDLIGIGGSAFFNSISAFNSLHPGYDDHSTGLDPGFPTNSLLFPSDSLAIGTGIPLAEVPDDFNDSLRDPLTPTMGAMEVPPFVIHDSSTKDIRITMLNDTIVLGSNTVSVRISNLAPFTPDSSLHLYEGVIDTIYLSCSLNGDSTVYGTWIGSLALGDSVTFNFPAAYSITRGRIYKIHIEAYLPGQFKAINLQDDSLTKELGTAMFGPYTIGGSGPDFINAVEAASNLRKAGVSGNVEFNFRPGLDTLFGIDQYRAPYDLVWQSESHQASDVRLLFSVCRECYRITFRNLTIHPLTNTSAMYDYKGAEFIGGQLSLDSCIIRGLNDPGFRNGITFVHTDSLSVTNCHFINLEHGITLSTYQWYGSNHFTGNNYFINNTFDSVANCIHLLGRFTGDSTYLAGNIMHNPAVGVEFSPESFDYRFVMEKNKITGASTYALYAGETISFSVGEFYASNNMFGGAVVFYSFNNAPLNFNFNSIFGRLQIMDGRNVHLRNNTVYNPAATDVFTFWQSFFGTTTYDCDYNNYFSSGGGVLASLFIDGLGSATTHSIAGITAFTGAEIHSVSTNPLYVSPVDLHSTSPVLSNAGTPVPGITTDIDDELRNAVAPDIGCDEFPLPSAVQELSREPFFTLHPNPASESILLTYDLRSASHVKIELADRMGRSLRVLKNEIQQAGNYLLPVDFGSFSIAKGFYLVRMTVDSRVFVGKLVVQ